MRYLLPLALAALTLFSAPTAGAADFGFAPGGVTLSIVDGAGNPDLRAGGHPDRMLVGLQLKEPEAGASAGNLKDLAVELPPGLLGDPTAVAACPRRVFEQTVFSAEVKCPPQSQVGTVDVSFAPSGKQTVPIYNIEAAPDQMAVLGFSAAGKFPIEMRLRPGDYGVTIEDTGLNQTIPLRSIAMELWGVPVDHQEGGEGLQRRPFLTLPTRCDGGPLAIVARIRSWQDPETWHSAEADTGAPPSGCGELGFDPRVEFDLSDPIADAPTGATVKLASPDKDGPDGRIGSEIRDVRLEMPEGVSVSPGGAVGLEACSDPEFGLGAATGAGCPGASKVGSVELTSPILRDPLTGSVYVGQEAPGNRFRLLVDATGPGVVAKLAGSLRPDPRTGRLTMELDDLPQIPVESIALRFDGGPRALLVTPLACGPATVDATFAPYNGAASANSSDTVAVGENPAAPGCGSKTPFAPGFEAGTTPARAGRSTAFSVTLRRRDGEQSPDRFALSFPPGLVAALGSATPCPAATAAAAACPATSRIGSSLAEVGSGPSPASLRGDVYLTGAYRRAPFGLALAFRAVLGPFDLGTLTVRSALRIDPLSGRVTVETDSLPRLVEGLPVRFRTIGLDIDRPGFIRNPTSCEPSQVGATVRSISGALSSPASPFLARGCDRLGFRPRFSIALTGSSGLRRGGHPGLRVGVRARAGDTNLRGADIRLPDSLSFDASGLRAICSRRDAGEGVCPKGSMVGTATGRTPLLHGSLKGSIYVVQPQGSGLPDLWTVLRGDGVRLDVRSRTVVRDGQAHTSLVGVPDLPLARFAMNLTGGEHGILSLSSSLCVRRVAAKVGVEGQDRAFRILRVPVAHPVCKGRGIG